MNEGAVVLSLRPSGHFLTTTQTHLILGGAGFIGRHVAAELLAQGHRLVIADRVALDCAAEFGADANAQSVIVDLSVVDWDMLVSDADVVHHYAWTSIPASADGQAQSDLNSNLTTVLGLLDALRRLGRGRLIFSSSGGTVYGKAGSDPIREDCRLAPITAYGAGKATAEIYMGIYRAQYGIDCRIARIANPYGARQEIRRGQGALTTFTHQALTDEEIVIWGDGTVTRDYVHVTDVTRALVNIAVLPSMDEQPILNIGSGQGVSLNDIVDALQRRLGRLIRVQRTPSRSFDVPVNILDISAASRVIGWRPALSFTEGLDRTINEIGKQIRRS
jgi:UDP-glucose 4-epimerase